MEHTLGGELHTEQRTLVISLGRLVQEVSSSHSHDGHESIISWNIRRGVQGGRSFGESQLVQRQTFPNMGMAEIQVLGKNVKFIE